MNKLRNICCLLMWLMVYSIISYSQNRGYAVQTASRQSETEAKAEMAKLAAAGLPAHLVRANVPGKGTWYRVRFGHFNTLVEAQLSAEQALRRGAISEFIVTLYETPVASASARREAAKPSAEKKSEENSLPNSDKLASNRPRKTTEQAAPTEDHSATAASARTSVPKETAIKESGNPATKKPHASDSQTKAPAANPNFPLNRPQLATKGTRSNPNEALPHEPGTLATNESAPAKSPDQSVKTERTSTRVTEKTSARSTETPVSTTATLSSNKPVSPDKVSPVPRIAQPPIPDALGEVDLTNRNWKIVRRSNATDKNLRTIYFVDSMTGWAAGDAGALFRTTDGGKTWKPLLSGAAANINQIFFIDWNNGWMLGDMARKEDGELETVLLSTSNGGRSWQRKPLPNILNIFFTDAQHGWAVGKNATILRTDDGGNSWKPFKDLENLIGLPVESSNYNYGFRDIHFLTPQQGWLIGNFYGRSKSNIGGLFVTSDGGASWKRIPFTVQTKFSSGRFTPGVLYSVRFSDLNTGTLTGEMFDGDERFFFVLHTRDGGKNWEQYRTPSQATHSTQFLGTALGWTAAAAPREGGADAVVYDTTLMRTDNGGASWQYDFVARGSRIRGVFFLSTNKGWAVGDRGMILRYEEKHRVN